MTVLKESGFMNNKIVVIVVGGGAGIMASIAAARNGEYVSLLEKN